MDIRLSDFFRFNPFDNKNSSEFLKLLPEISRSEDGKIIDAVDVFWKYFYYDNTELLGSTTQELIDNIGDPNIHFIVFKGPSGSGKTTYLNNIIREKEKFFKDPKDTPLFDVINLIEHPFTSTTEPSLLLNVLYNKILGVVDPFFIKILYQTIKEGEKKLPKESQRVKLLMESYTNFMNVLAKCNRINSVNPIRDKICQFIKSVDKISEVIAYYFIFYIIKNCIIDKREELDFKSMVFVFDNLDELEFRYLARNLAIDFFDAFSKAQEFLNLLKKTNTIAGGYDFISHCTLIESVREGFVADSNTSQFEEACQHIDRIDNGSSTIQFDINYKDFTHNIAKMRYDLYELCLEKEGQVLKRGRFGNGELLVTEKAQIDNLSNLFNNDYRMTLSCLSKAFTEDISAWKEMALNDNDCILGVRGMMLFHMLKALYTRGNNAFSDYISAELNDESCNKNRMYMSLLANNDGMEKRKADGYSPQDDQGLSLRKFTEKVKFWYKDTEVSKIYESVFVSNNHNYSILACLEGNQIDTYFKSKDKEITLKNLCKSLADCYINNPDELNAVKIVVNPVCSSYTKDVFINFEYFNLISIHKKDLYNAKSLFQYESYEEVASCLKRVYNITKTIVKRADSYVCEKCKYCDLHSENKEQQCFIQIQKLNEDGFLINNSLYKTRVINSHINYLDSFRKMMWHKYHEHDQEMYEKFHNLILSYINYYINNLFYNEKGLIDKSKLFIEINDRYEEAKSTGCNEWVSISIGR